MVMYETTQLSNGLTVISNYMPHTRSVSINIYVGIGSRYEDNVHAGISHFVEHMLFKGSTDRPSSVAISGAIEDLGGLFNGGTDRQTTNFWCKVAHSHFRQALDVLIDMVRYPLIDEAEVEKERGVIQEELNMTNDSPNDRVDVLTDEMLWPHHPMGRDIGGTRESVDGITHEMLRRWYSSYYGASNVVISVAGNIPHDEVLAAVVPLVSDWPRGSRPVFTPVQDNDALTSSQILVEHRRTQQAHVCISLRGLPTRHPDRYAFDMMSSILGGGMSSRLFVEVREKQGLAYDVSSGTSHFPDTGSLVVYFGVEPKKVSQAIRTVLEELRKIQSGVQDPELARAKEFAKGHLLLRMEDTRAVSAWAGAQEILYREVITVDEVVDRVNHVTSADVGNSARAHLQDSAMNLAVVGPFRSDRQFHRLLPRQ